MKIKLLLLLILLLPFKLSAITGYDSGDTLNCLAVSGLKIRSQPGGTTVIGKVPYGDRVIISPKPWGVPETNLGYVVEGISGNWVKINYGAMCGFVFDGFLGKLPAPSLQHHSLKDYAEASFSRSGKKHTYHHTDEENPEADTLEFFVYKGNFIIFEERFGYESYSVALTIESTSAEECYLIARTIFKSDVDTVINSVKNHPDKYNIQQQKENAYIEQAYGTFTFKDGKYELALMDEGCYDIISVVRLSSNIYQIRRSSGC